MLGTYRRVLPSELQVVAKPRIGCSEKGLLLAEGAHVTVPGKQHVFLSVPRRHLLSQRLHYKLASEQSKPISCYGARGPHSDSEAVIVRSISKSQLSVGP